MNTISMPEDGCPFSLRETKDTLPFDAYTRMREAGSVIWDEDMKSWLVTSYDACREVLMKDKEWFRHPDGDPEGDYAVMAKGLRPLKSLVGEEHRKLHNWLMAAFSPRETAIMQDGVVRDVIQSSLDRLDGRDQINLVADFIDRIPIRVIAAVLDLPWKDEAWVGEAQRHLTALGAFFNQRMAMTNDISKAAEDATAGMRALLDPILLERKDGTGDDLITKLWEVGPTILPDWTIDDTFVHINTVFLGGFDTSSLAISNAFYFLLQDDGLKAEIRKVSPERLQNFVEEVLRLLPPNHYRARRANKDLTIAGVDIRKDEFVLPMLASANRDAEHYGCPADMMLDRKMPRDHLSFITGPRSCVGAGLARTEIRETICRFLEVYPDVRLAPDKPSPSYIGLTLRRFEPIYVRLQS